MEFKGIDLRKLSFWLVSCVLFLFCFGGIAFAQLEEEMEILKMFYKDKDLVVTPTHHPKPISQVPENITVITAQEIENMNAHNVADVLNRIPGLFINYSQDMGASSLLQIQGSEPRHVLVLLDGIRWNYLSSGAAETNSIPVGIIDRIEIIKGPASSSWGSALGGVVNIITKPVGNTSRPTGVLSASGGERETQDYKAQVAGLAGPVGYYLYAGEETTRGLRKGRDFETYNLYSKFHIPLSSRISSQFTLGYSEPDLDLWIFPSNDIHSTAAERTFFATGSLSAMLSPDFDLQVSFHKFKQKAALLNDSLGLWGLPFDPPGSRFYDGIYEEETTGGEIKFSYNTKHQTIVWGGEFDQGELDQTIKAGPLLQLFGAPPLALSHPDIDRWGIYLNDTIGYGNWSITPGVRYDRNNITGSFVSPSIGITYRFYKDSLLRATVARGFIIPPLSWTSGGGLFLDPNPSLDVEEIWSYQAGVETAAFKYFWLKTNFFRHEVDKAFVNVLYGGGPPSYNDLIVNRGERRRQGGELELETIPFHHFSLQAGFTYVHYTPPTEAKCRDHYSYSLGLRYDDFKSFRAEIFGHYVWWDLNKYYQAKYDDFIWDLNLSKKIFSREKTASEFFLTAHNLLNGSQYTLGESKNPRRWVEAGIRVKFK